MPKHKKIKDPNRPKRPLTAFMRYSSVRRKKIRETQNDKSMIEISKIIGEEWKTITDSDKRPYHDAASRDHEVYRLAKEAYDKTKPKRPRTAYALFMKSSRSDIAAKHPDTSPRDLMKFIAAHWKALDSESREKYNALALEDRKRWERDRNSI